MVANVVLNVGILVTFKYYNFFADNLANLVAMLGYRLDWVTLRVVLPVGISFLRYRQRYVDLVVNDGVRETFEKRATILRTLRAALDEAGYTEVETPHPAEHRRRSHRTTLHHPLQRTRRGHVHAHRHRTLSQTTHRGRI